MARLVVRLQHALNLATGERSRQATACHRRPNAVKVIFTRHRGHRTHDMTGGPHQREATPVAQNQSTEVTNIDRNCNNTGPRKSVAHTIAGARSMLRSAARRDDLDLPNIAELAELQRELSAIIAGAVANVRNTGSSWADVGRALGTSREAAYQRFGK